VGSLLGGFSRGKVRAECGARVALLRRCRVKKKQWGMALELGVGGPVQRDTKEGRAW
jgi:hypothetical protein